MKLFGVVCSRTVLTMRFRYDLLKQMTKRDGFWGYIYRKGETERGDSTIFLYDTQRHAEIAKRTGELAGAYFAVKIHTFEVDDNEGIPRWQREAENG